ncbi:MAG: hypothetical protein GKR90_21655 [Pseudomonadales bacterium]|nr:hypothetical protein [Pseudomonadales bacterium]
MTRVNELAPMAQAKHWLRKHVDWLWAGVYRGVLQKNTRVLPAGLDVHLATPAELRSIATEPMWEMTQTFVNGAIARGDECVVGYLDGQLVSYGWAGYGKTPHTRGTYVCFARGHRYNYKAFTAPEYRGRHLRGSFGVLEAADRRREVRHSIAFIDYRNKASAQAEMRNGGNLIGYAGYIRIGKLLIAYSTTSARQYEFKFTNREPFGS